MALSNIGANPAQHVVRALIGAGVMAALCAIAWSFIAARADDHSTWLALLTGLLVGLSVRRFGKALGDWFGLIAVAGTMAATLAGSVLAILALTAQEQQLSYLQVWLVADLNMIYHDLNARISAVDAICLGIAVLLAYVLATVRISKNTREHVLPHIVV